MAYSTTEPPFDPKYLPEYLSRELRQIEAELRRPTWIDATLENGWDSYSLDHPTANHADAQYARLANGIVMLRGLIEDGTMTSGTTLFSLPDGYRPLKRLVYAQLSNAGLQRVDVSDDGRVRIWDPIVVTDWLSLDGITFLAEQ